MGKQGARRRKARQVGTKAQQTRVQAMREAGSEAM
jgi:hypothetical protein